MIRISNPSPHGALWSGHDDRPELPLVAATDAHVARLGFVFGVMPALPPIPASLGAWADVPDRRREQGIAIPAAGTRRRA